MLRAHDIAAQQLGNRRAAPVAAHLPNSNHPILETQFDPSVSEGSLAPSLIPTPSSQQQVSCQGFYRSDSTPLTDHVKYSELCAAFYIINFLIFVFCITYVPYDPNYDI